jgi:phosphate transport system protein
MLTDVLSAYRNRDADAAAAVWSRDREIDEQHSGLFRELLTYMMEDARAITPTVQLLFIAKNIERVGDLATNISEIVTFLVTGKPIPGTRPKGDTASMALP